MRSRSRQADTSLPEVNLIPMMNAMLAILAFFVIVAMSLSSFQTLTVELPPAEDAIVPPNLPAPLIAKLQAGGQIRLNDQPVNQAELTAAIRTYLATNPQGSVLLQADAQVPYREVIQLLGTMQDAGGDRVSLAID
ncbi:biopolymer transporter ExbD [Trichothermofontia sichuanensis B231]|uniref:ExbD/TolR family protein n=1 Tax=Trichothermofontia sichuanensis TaxID=3045816 RepID=UPI0022460A79|nr:biopolymer transporter ExbD [Trichothermofontia sichuanensis]UZQ53393.1 biopolymer transporter ExbD [Trichothermofontia sichuanensis B231]